jgi:hypothetical protein
MQLKMILAGGAVLLIPIAGVLAWLAWQWQSLAPPMQSTLRVLVFGVPLALAISGGYVALTVAWRRYADRQMIEADKLVALQLAQRPLPDALTSLSYSYHDSHHALPAPDLRIETLPQLPPPTVPTFAQLLDQGAVGAGQPLCLGYDASGRAISGSWNDLYSCGVGGMTGSGKSWAVAFLAGQSAAAGARIILIDPHAGDGESLSNRLAGLSASYVCDVASTPTDIESALKLAADKLEKRRTGRGGTWPLLLICDEWTSLLRGRTEDLLTATALDIAETGRKYGVFTLLAAQAWQVAAAGAVRDRLASHYVLRTRGDQFRYQTGLRTTAAPADTLTLQAGQAYLLSVRGELQKITIPLLTPPDITRLGLLIDRPAAHALPPFGFTPVSRPVISAVAKTEPIGSQNVAGPSAATSAAQSVKMVSAEARHAAGLFVAGKSPAEIVEALRGVKSNQGSKYQQALSEILDLVREGIQ